MSKEQAQGTAPFMTVTRLTAAAGESASTGKKSPLLHCHREAAYVTVQTGGATANLGGTEIPLATGDSLIIDPYTPYRVTPDPDKGGDCLCIRLSLDALYDRELQAGLEEGRLATHPLYKRAGGGVLVAGCLRAAYFSCEGRKSGWEFAALGQISMLYAHLSACGAIAPRKEGRSSSLFVRRTVAYMEEHYGEPITSADAAAALSVNASAFCRRFRATFGTTFSLYLSALRMERAARLLRETAEPIHTVMAAVGFADFSYFSKTFREATGLSPSAYRKEHANI